MAKYTILLVDYDPRSIGRTCKPLEEAGFRVEVAKDGLAAIEAFAKIGPDLVLLEAMIPKKHGFEVCQEMKRTPAGQKTPVIIITAVYKGRKYRMQALHLHGADEYVERPVPDDRLVRICSEHLGRAGAKVVAPASAPAKSKSEPSAPAGKRKTKAKTTSSPHTPEEDEILAHLDAILTAEASGESSEEGEDDSIPGAAIG